MKKKILLGFLLLLSAGQVCRSQPIPDNAEGRLWRLCKVWGYLKYYSPRTCQINWDSLLQQTVPLVKNAATNAEFNEYVHDLLRYAGQIPPELATPPPLADSNLNLQLEWTGDPMFSIAVRGFLDTFKSRAGRNDSLGCRLKRHDYSDPTLNSFVDFRKDLVRYTPNYTLEADRLVTLFYHWNVFNYFGPYRKLNDRNWDSVLLDRIPEAIAATSELGFMKVMVKTISRIDDSHAGLNSSLFDYYLGIYFAGLQFKRIENRIIVTKVKPEITGIALGDELLEVNGVPLTTIFNGYRDLYASSNDATFYRQACYTLVRTQANTPKTYTFRNASAQTYTQSINHSLWPSNWGYWVLDTLAKPVWTTLCNGYGYVNMGRLQGDQVAQMYQELKDKPGIVFDVRNYPKGTMTELMRYLFAGPVVGSRYFAPDLGAPGWYTVENDSITFGQWSNPNPYSGRLFFLVNEQTQSHAEYTVQYLSLAPGAKVVGSQTAGADGNINSINDRGIYFSFSGLGWYYADWYQCQRNGIRIDEVVMPTIAGIREGKDEVLESITGCPTGVGKALPASLSARLYPNPAASRLTIGIDTDHDDKFSLRISDVMGKVCYSVDQKQISKPGTDIDISLSALPAGVYFIHIRSDRGKVFAAKLVKQ